MKKLNKFFAVLVALAMMATLCISSAFAAVDESKVGKSLATTGFQKTFDVPDGVTRPAASFTFKFTPNANNPSGPTAPWQNVAIDIASGVGTGTGFKHLSDIFTIDKNYTGTDKVKLTEAGEYLFEVEEIPGTYTLQTGEKVTYDGNHYTLRIYLTRNDNGNLEEKAITVVDTDDDDEGRDADKIDPTEDTKPVDPTPDEPQSGDETTEGLGTSDWEFINYYTKNVTDNSEDGAFHIQKLAAKNAATNKDYDFTVAITVDPQTVAEYKDAETGKYTLTAGDKSWEFTEGNYTATVTGIKLKANDKLVFNTFPAGATVQVKENLKADTTIQNAAAYTKSVAANDIKLDDGTATGAASQDFGKDADVDVTTMAYDVKSNVKVTNTLSDDDITPTGILMNNLPYIVLALVAIGGLVAYVVVRRRNADEA